MTTTNPEWELRDGLDPTHLRQAFADHTRKEEERRAANLAAFKKEEAQARAELEQSAETFRAKLGQILGTDVPADAIRISQYSDTPITSRILTLEETTPTTSSAAERAQELLTALSANPRNQRGLRGALIALAWSNLATSHNRT